MTCKGPAVGSGRWMSPRGQRGLGRSTGCRARRISCHLDGDLRYRVAVCECAVFTCLLSDGSRTEPESKPEASRHTDRASGLPKVVTDSADSPRPGPRPGASVIHVTAPPPAPCEMLFKRRLRVGRTEGRRAGSGSPGTSLRQGAAPPRCSRTDGDSKPGVFSPLGARASDELECLLLHFGVRCYFKERVRVPEWSSNSSGRGRGCRAGSAEWFWRAPV